MSTDDEYIPSPKDFVAEHVRRYEATGDVMSGPFEGQPTVVLTTRGRKSGKLRKTPLVRVEKNGEYAVVASLGGADRHPAWYLNLRDDPEVTLQDGPTVLQLKARTATPEEKREWWPTATAVWPAYDDYQQRTDRDIPIVLFEHR